MNLRSLYGCNLSPADHGTVMGNSIARGSYNTGVVAGEEASIRKGETAEGVETVRKETVMALMYGTSLSSGHMGFLHEPGDGFRPAFDMQFIKNIRQVVFHRFVAQPQLDGDFFIGFSFSQKRQDQTLLR